MPGILFRMILGDLVRVFLLALVALTGLFILAGLVAEATQRGLAPSQVLLFIPLLVPNTLPYTIPATTLFATCFVYGRLAADNEVTAMRASGIHLMRIIYPCLLLGVLASAVTIALYYEPIPWTHVAMRREIKRDVQAYLYSELRRNHALRNTKLDFVLYVKDVRGDRLIDAIYKHRVKTPGVIAYKTVARAREAVVSVDLPNRKIIVDMDHGLVFEDKVSDAVFTNQRFEVDLPEGLVAEPDLRAVDLTWQQIRDRQVEMTDTLAGLIAGRNKLLGQAPSPNPDTARHDQAQVAYYDYQIKVCQSEQRQLVAELWLRPAMALGCLCFVAVGCPVGIWFSKSDYLSSFVSCFLPTVFIYYPLMLCGGNLAKDGKVPPWSGAFLADAVMAVAAVALTWRVLRR